MTKVMHLDMFCFDYSPVFTEKEKVLYSNGQIIVTHNGNVKILDATDVSEIKFDTLHDERMKRIRKKPWTVEEIIKSLELMDSNNQEEKDKYRLLYTDQDEIDVSFEFMTNTLFQLNYKEESFEYIAYGYKNITPD